MQEANSGTTATARPLPKRTRSTAGLEEIDAWLSQIADSGSGSGQSTTSASTSTTSSALTTTTTTTYHTSGVPVPGSGQPHETASSRKRHHSLPTSSLSGSFAPHTGLGATRGVAPQIHGYDDTFTTFHPAPAAMLRPELSVFKTQRGGFSSSSGRRISNQHSPSLHSGAYSSAVATPRTSNAVALAATLLPPPEMSPREDFLVRAFVSDAMKLELEHHRRQYNNNDDGDHGGATTTSPTASACTTTTTPSTTSYSPSPLSLIHLDEIPPPQMETPTSQNQSQSHQKWTREEDDKLRDTVTRFGGKSWKLIAETLGNNRTDVQCLHRWNKVLKPGLVKGPWTPEEDRVLLDLIARYGVGQIRWCDVALHLPGRIGKQCRERWCNHLDSSIRKGQWTPEEDDTVFRLQQQMGNKWSEIAKTLPGRTENAVKNRFNSAARRKWLVSQALRTPAKSSSVDTTVTTQTQTKPRTSISRTSPTTPAHALSHPPASPVTPSRSYSSASVRRGATNLLSSGLLAGPPRPPPQSFRGVSYVVAPPPPSPAFLPSVTTTATGLELFPFVDGYHSPLQQQQQQQQHQQSLMFESPGQQHQQIAYGTSNISRNTINDTRPSIGLGFSLYQSHDHHNQQQQQPQHHEQRQHQQQHHKQHQSFLQLSGSNTSLIKQEASERSFFIPQSPLGLDLQDERQQGDDSGDNQESDGDRATPPEVLAKRSSYYEPQVESGEDDDDHALRSIDIPDCAAGGEDQDAGGAPSSSPVMDDQNMSTFLDSVALELDDMI